MKRIIFAVLAILFLTGGSCPEGDPVATKETINVRKFQVKDGPNTFKIYRITDEELRVTCYFREGGNGGLDCLPVSPAAEAVE